MLREALDAHAALHELRRDRGRREPVGAASCRAAKNSSPASFFSPCPEKCSSSDVVARALREQVLDPRLDLRRPARCGRPGRRSRRPRDRRARRRAPRRPRRASGSRRRPGCSYSSTATTRALRRPGHRQVPDACRLDEQLDQPVLLVRADACDSSRTSPPSSSRTVRTGPGERASHPRIAVDHGRESAGGRLPSVTSRPPTVAARARGCRAAPRRPAGGRTASTSS